MKLLEKFEAVARQRRLAENTIDAYRGWIQQFLRFCATARGQWTRPEELGAADVEAFLNDLVGRRRLSASSQNQALNALVFLYTQVLDALPENHLGKFAPLRSNRPRRVPTVLSAVEVKRVIEAIPQDHISRLLTELMYGTGMRVGVHIRGGWHLVFALDPPEARRAHSRTDQLGTRPALSLSKGSDGPKGPKGPADRQGSCYRSVKGASEGSTPGARPFGRRR